jgi:hypothetical protein
MTILYDPKTKKPKPWIIITIILMPIALIIIALLILNNFVKKEKTGQPEEQGDILGEVK